MTSKTSSTRQWAMAIAVIVLIAGSLLLLRHELRAYNYHQVAAEIMAIPLYSMLAAVGYTVLSYLLLPGYDYLALTYIRRPLPLRRIVLGSGVAYGLSQMLGFPMLTGGVVRYRFWSAWGLSTTEIARATGFVGATFTVGAMVMCGVALLFEPDVLLDAMHIPPLVAHVLGAILLLACVGYVVWSVVRRGQPIRIRGWEFIVPTPRLAIGQIVSASADWIAAGAVLYALFPAHTEIGFFAFIGAFVLAQFAGFISHVPGGLGVFDTVMFLGLESVLPADQILGTLLVYRVIYYLLPFLGSLLALVLYEWRRQHQQITQGARAVFTTTAAAITRWGPSVLPMALSTTTFAGGVVLLLSGATPAEHGRITALGRVLPLGVIEVSHFVGSMAGVGLLVLAWAIGRRLDAAYALTLSVMALGIVASLLKGLDWEEAAILSTMFMLVASSRRSFYRKTALWSEPLTPGWIAAVIVVVGASVWLGFFAFKHVEYGDDLWWRFALRADAPRFLRTTAGVVGLLLTAGVLRLLRHSRAEPACPTEMQLDTARVLASASSDTEANLALLGDKALLFSAAGDGFLMYGVEGRSWVALGDPVGTPVVRAELAWRFREEADRHGAWPVFYEVSTQSLPLYIDLGLTLLKLGEQARVPLATFTLEGRKSFRRALRDAEREGVTFEIIPAVDVPPLLPELKRVSDAWLVEKNTREKGFSLGRFNERYLGNFPMAIVRKEGQVVAFANLWMADTREELSVDLMRHTNSAPRNVMDYLFIQLMLWGNTNGFRWFNLGMAPLSGFENRLHAPMWTRVGAMLFRHGEHFYNFQGIRNYKEKFEPVWEPRYLASPGGLVLPRILANVAALISGGLKGVVSK